MQFLEQPQGIARGVRREDIGVKMFLEMVCQQSAQVHFIIHNQQNHAARRPFSPEAVAALASAASRMSLR